MVASEGNGVDQVALGELEPVNFAMTRAEICKERRNIGVQTRLPRDRESRLKISASLCFIDADQPRGTYRVERTGVNSRLAELLREFDCALAS